MKKKYRLIEYRPDGHTVVTLSTIEGLYNRQKIMQAGHPNYTYRIEEFEESIKDRVKSYEDACTELHMAAQKLSLYPKHIAALLKLEAITAALNEGWKPDWEDMEQVKWFVTPCSKSKHCVVNSLTTISHTPSRLYFKSRELAEYAAKQFAELYKQLLIEKF